MSLSFAALRNDAPQRLNAEQPLTWNRSDDDMNERARMIPEGVVPKPAAVLVGVLENENGPSILLTQRKATLSKHAGQIAFPGGRMDAGETAVQAALREAQEETGLDPALVRPLGFLDGYLTVTGYFVRPASSLCRRQTRLMIFLMCRCRSFSTAAICKCTRATGTAFSVITMFIPMEIVTSGARLRAC
jgi:8-oxo-dGTP pyrophosphatase MutT (NUDIX family)